VYLGVHFLLDIAGSIVVATLAGVAFRGNYRWVTWLRRQVERIIALVCSAASVAAGKR
jgi:membrane-associated phospholipid phosphatase